MRTLMLPLAALLLGIGSPARSAAQDTAQKSTAPVEIVDVLSSRLDMAEDVEVIVSRVVMLPDQTLPKHWHPGEEFIYVLEGAVTLWQEGEDKIELTAGEAFKVPLKKVHAASTGPEGGTALVFRVHESGQPARVVVD